MADEVADNSAPDPSEYPPHLFLVRVWWETGNKGRSGEWRGWVEHVSTRKKHYFRVMETVSEFIDKCLKEVIL